MKRRKLEKYVEVAVDALLKQFELNVQDLTIERLEQLPGAVSCAIKSLLPEDWLPVAPQPEVNGVRYMSVSRAEEYSSVSRWTLTRAAARGELKMIKLGQAKSSKVLFDREDIDRWMRSRRCR